MARKITENALNVSIVLMAVGTGLHAGKVYYLNLLNFSFSIFSLIRYFSSGDTSIFYLSLIIQFYEFQNFGVLGFWGDRKSVV